MFVNCQSHTPLTPARTTKSNLGRFFRTLVFLSPLLIFLASCKHEPEEYIPIDPDPPADTLPTGITCNPDTAYFQNDVLPLLISSCAMSGCHDASTAQDGVVLTSYQTVMNTGEIIAGNPGGSKLYEAITENDIEDRMPPSPMDALSTGQILLIRKWIEQGARNNYCDSDCDTANFTYSGAIRTILNKHCKGCHSGNGASGGIKLDNYADTKAAADNGSLYGAVSHQPGYSPMPKNASKLTECNIVQIRKWIEGGAPEN